MSGIELPASAAAPGGRTRVLRLRFRSPGQPVLGQVNCRIPQTREAADAIVRMFVRQTAQPVLSRETAPAPGQASPAPVFVDPKRRGRHLAQDASAPAAGPSRDDGCVLDGECVLDPIGDPVNPFPAPTYSDPWQCYWGCGWNASAADYGGGDYYDPGSPPETLADDNTADCHLTDSGNCDLHPATPEQMQHARAEVAKIKDEGVCGTIKAKAGELLDRGLNVWDNPVRQGGELLVGDLDWQYVDATGVERVPVIDIWSDPRYFNGWTIAHEAMHAISNWNHDPTSMTYLVGPDGVTRDFDATAKYCSGY